MTVTLPLDEDLVREAEAYAKRTGSDLRTLVEESLREALKQDTPSPEKERRLKIPSQPMGLKPGIDLSNNAQVRDIMDAADERLNKLSRQK